MKSILILGAGGHGRVVAELAELNGYERIAFLDEEWERMPRSGAWEVVGGLDELSSHAPEEWHCVAAFGNNRTRLEALDMALAKGFHAPVLVHPLGNLSRHAETGPGGVICAQASLGPFAHIGRGCILNTGCSVDHDCILGPGAHISPGARLAGGVTIGARSWIGMGAVVRELTRVEEDVTIGAGAVVLSDVKAGLTMTGAPARPMNRKS